MSVDTTCPSLPELKRYADGALQPGEAARLAEHVRTCPVCRQAVAGGEALQPTLPESATLPALASPPGGQYVLTPPPEKPAAAPPDTRRATALLAPPQAAGEIGRFGQYPVHRVIGSGGMGTVFAAEDPQLEREVALKILNPALLDDGVARERFLREARAAAKIKDERIVTIYQVGEVDGVPFIEMELLEGESLEWRLKRQPRLTAAEVLDVGRQVALSLGVAHARGLLHRDVKPANVFLVNAECGIRNAESRSGGARSDSAFQVKLLDFGLVRPMGKDSSLTADGHVAGTPGYMAPEQARGLDLDERCDLFALGCVLYRMAGGKDPFPGKDVLAILTALAVDDPEPLRNLAPELPLAVVELIEDLLEKDPDDRPASTRVVVERIDAILAAGSPAPPSRDPTARPRHRSTRRYVVAGILAVGLTVGALLLGKPWRDGGRAAPDPTLRPIKVGVLHSTTGTLKDSGSAAVDGTVLAIDEINAAGGLLGRRVEVVLRDGESDPAAFERQARRLLAEEGVCVVFGCWTSAERKAVVPVVERLGGLLVYPVQYEGLEQSPHVLYVGAVPNQRVVPAIQFCIGFLNKQRFFLVGSDEVYCRTINAVIGDELKKRQANVVGEAYVPLGSSKTEEIVWQIQGSRPDLIVNTICGDSMRPFIRELRAAGWTPEKAPNLFLSLTETELAGLTAAETVGDYAVSSYFMSVPGEENRAFVERFRERFGPQRMTADVPEAAYASVHLWARAVAAAGTEGPGAVRRALGGQTFAAPEGEVRVDDVNGHTWRPVRIGKVVAGGQFEVVFEGKAEQPGPYPGTRSRAEWDKFLDGLYRGWGGRWEAPPRP